MAFPSTNMPDDFYKPPSAQAPAGTGGNGSPSWLFPSAQNTSTPSTPKPQAQPSVQGPTLTKPLAGFGSSSPAPQAPAQQAKVAPAYAAPMSSSFGGTNLKYGATGSQVKQIQQKLGIADDGIWGPQTQQAVLNYQKAHGLSADGVVGPNTWGSLFGGGGSSSSGGGSQTVQPTGGLGTKAPSPDAPQQQQTTGGSDLASILASLGVDPTKLQAQAQQEYQQQTQAYMDQIKQLQQQEQADANNLQNGFNGSVQDLENKTFQQWLANREKLSDRGLGNSGFMNDAMTRLQLMKEQQEQGLASTLQDNLTKSAAPYDQNILKATQAAEALNPETMYQTLYQNAMKDATPLLPYLMPTADQTAQLTGYLDGKPTLTNMNDQVNWAKTIGDMTGQFTNPFTGQSQQTLQALQDMFDNNLKTNQFNLDSWYKQQTIADNQKDIAIRQGNLDLAKNEDAIKNQQAQDNITNTTVKNTLSDIYQQQTKAMDLMNQLRLSDPNGVTTPSSDPSSTYAKYTQAYQDYLNAQNKYDNVLQTYIDNQDKSGNSQAAGQ